MRLIESAPGFGEEPLSSDHLQQAAERVSDRFSSQAFGF